MTPSRPLSAAPGNGLAFVWRRFLPWHVARMRHLEWRLAGREGPLWGIEVASLDDSYSMLAGVRPEGYRHVCCFPGVSYDHLTAGQIHRKVRDVLGRLGPAMVFAPASPFPEGMAACRYRMASGARMVLMDDAWEYTDRSGFPTRAVKRSIHRNVDGAFIPAPGHAPYFSSLGFPEERLAYGVDAVDNEFFSGVTRAVRAKERQERRSLGLPDRFFLFVGRLLPVKGLDTLLKAYGRYRGISGEEAWNLVVVGSGPCSGLVLESAARVPGIMVVEAQYQERLAGYYALASALVVPSLRETWGTVINEGLACGLPVLVSRGCGAAGTLVREGENGWTFDPGDVAGLSSLMIRLAGLSGEALLGMGRRSEAIVAPWSLDAFVSGVERALAMPRRGRAGLVSDVLTMVWRGRVRSQ